MELVLLTIVFERDDELILNVFMLLSGDLFIKLA